MFMISNRHKASFRKHKDSGVSEIIGDILILAMTVTLFSTVFVFVNAFPTPNAQTFVNFNATLSNSVNTTNFTNAVFLNITHEGGQALTSSLTSVVVQINQNTNVYALSSGYVFVNSTLAIPWPSSGSTKWTTSQTWIMNLTDIIPSSVVGVSIIDKANNYVVWSTILKGKQTNVPPEIETAYANPNPVTPGNTITVFAKIYPPSNHMTVTANVSLVTVSSGVVSLTYNNSTDIFQSAKIVTSNFLKIGNSYPITVNVLGPGPHSSNYTFNLLVQNTGPSIVMAAISPNPGTLGTYFNITAYVIDSNQSAFQPPTVGYINVTPQSPMITNITSTEPMVPSSSSPGIFTLSGRVNSAFTGNFETFVVTATDVNGNKALFVVELVVIQALNLSSSFPYQYLGPTSMSFSGFSWNTPGSTATKGYEIPALDVIGGGHNAPSPGVYFHVIVENHNASETTYINYLSNIYFLFTYSSNGQSGKLLTVMSFIVNSSTNYSLGSSLVKLSPNAPVNLTFGISGTSAPVSTDYGPFTGASIGSNDLPSSGTFSVDFVLLFGYEITNTGQNIPYGQTLPFTAIYWS